jgi:nitrous oxide reductase accessory protein NosL
VRGIMSTPNSTLALITVALLTIACSAAPSGPPEIVVDRTACSHCGMLISEPLYAAAYQAPDAAARVFDDIGCLRAAARGESGHLRFWFHDGEDRAWIDGTVAVFVASSEFRTPMRGGLIAYRDPAAAQRSAAKHHGRIIGSLTDLLTKEGGL